MNPFTDRTVRLLALASAALALSPCAPARADLTGAYRMENWTSSGIDEGTTTTVPVLGPASTATFSYDVYRTGGVPPRTTAWTVTAARSGPVTFHWHYTGYHAFSQAHALLQTVVNGPGGPTVVTLVDASTFGSFDFSGDATIEAIAGSTFGLIAGGQNHDIDTQFVGSVEVSGFTGPLTCDGPYAMDQWTVTPMPQGTAAITPPAGPAARPQLSYNVNLGNPGTGVPSRSATYAVVAEGSGPVSFDWVYSGFHAFFAAGARLEAFAETAAGTTSVTLVRQGTSGNFSFSGSASLNVECGRRFGLIASGSNGDSDSVLQGTVTLSNFRSPAGFSGSTGMDHWTSTGISEGQTRIVPSSGASPVAELFYDVELGDANGVSTRDARYSVPAAQNGTVSFDWTYDGYHAFFHADRFLHAFSQTSSGGHDQTLVEGGVFGPFSSSGHATIPVQRGMTWGVNVGGSNIDSDSRIYGTVALSNYCFTPCPADANGDGRVNVQDYLAFLSLYSAGNIAADFNGDGQINVQDYLAFLVAYARGC